MVVELQGIVSHIDLERGRAFLDQGGQILTHGLFSRVGNDQVKTIVDVGLGRGTGAVIIDNFAQ